MDNLIYYIPIVIIFLVTIVQIFISIGKLKATIRLYKKREKTYQDFLELLEEYYSNESVDAEIYNLRKVLKLSDYWV